MIKAKHLIAMGAGAALFATSGIASAASMEEYKEARSAAIEAADSVESMGAGAFAHSPTGSKWKKSLMHGADKMADKGNYEEAIAEAKRIKMLQNLAEKQYESQPSPGPYNGW